MKLAIFPNFPKVADTCYQKGAMATSMPTILPNFGVHTRNWPRTDIQLWIRDFILRTFGDLGWFAEALKRVKILSVCIKLKIRPKSQKIQSKQPFLLK